MSLRAHSNPRSPVDYQGRNLWCVSRPVPAAPATRMSPATRMTQRPRKRAARPILDLPATRTTPPTRMTQRPQKARRPANPGPPGDTHDSADARDMHDAASTKRRNTVYLSKTPSWMPRPFPRPLAQIRRCAIGGAAPGQSRPIRCIRPRQSLGVSPLIGDRGGDRNSGSTAAVRCETKRRH